MPHMEGGENGPNGEIVPKLVVQVKNGEYELANQTIQICTAKGPRRALVIVELWVVQVRWAVQ